MPSQTVSEAFQVFDDNLKLDPDVAKRARARRDELAECLADAGLAAETFGQGSFARKTMRAPLKDVDLVVVLPDTWRPYLYGVPGGPAKAFSMFSNAVTACLPGAVIDDVDEPADHALKVEFRDCEFSFDLVPAFAVAGSETVEIADRGDDTWEPSTARQLNRLIRERNVATGGQFVHQVRMVKALKDRNSHFDICGLAIESLCYQVITSEVVHDRALADVFTYAATAVYEPVLDPTGDDVSREWTPEQRHSYAKVFLGAARPAHEAVQLAAGGQHAAAIEVWHGVFGDVFPAAVAQTSAQALAAMVAGGVTSTGRAVTTPVAQQQFRPTRSWSRD